MQDSSSRRGAMALVMVFSVLGVVFAGVVAQNGAARHLASAGAGDLAGEQALRTAQLVLDDAAADLAEIAGSPAHPRFAALRHRLVEASGPAVDLTDLLPPPARDGALSWKRAAQPRTCPVGNVRVAAFRAVAEGLARLPAQLGGPWPVLEDERTGTVRLETQVEVRLAGQLTRRTLSERRELRLVLAGPPRPFDQTALVVADVATLTDAARANRHRASLLAVLDETVASLEQVSGQLSPQVARDLAEIRAGCPPPGSARLSMPALPTGRCAALGLSRPGSVTLAWLDLGARLEDDLAELTALHQQFLGAVGSVAKDGGAALIPCLTASLGVYNRASTRIWEYQRLLRVYVEGSPGHREVFDGYGERLSAAWYRARTALTLTPALLDDWARGARELDGVFALRSDAPVRLTGPRAGRAVLVVDAPEVALDGLTAASPGDLLTVVVSRGRVRVSGRVQAYLIIDGTANVEMSPDAELTGGLALRSSSRHVLAGRLRFSPWVPIGRTARASLALPGRGCYGLALSPVPLFTEGARQ